MSVSSSQDSETARLYFYLLCGVLFLSGCSALIFESVWFYLCGLVFGNSVWASDAVLSSFMGGLALGNGLASRYGTAIRRYLAAYAAIEIVIGSTGAGLTLLLPVLSEMLAPLFRPFLEVPLVLNPLRFGIAFLLLLVPATAMGMTLPLLVKGVMRWEYACSHCAWRAGSRTRRGRRVPSGTPPHPTRLRFGSGWPCNLGFESILRRAGSGP